MRSNDSDVQEGYGVIRFFFISEVDGGFNIVQFFCNLFNFDSLGLENKYIVDISEFVVGERA